MVKTRLLLAVALLCGLAVGSATAAPPGGAPDAGLPTLAETIRTNRKALVAVNLGLTADQATQFWPLYDQYEKELAVSGDKVVALVEEYTKSYKDLSNDKALQLLNDYLDAEAARVKIRQNYVAQFAKILPGRTVARFYQIENKMDAVLRYDLASSIPVVEVGAQAPAK
jgi:hypothetical protein